MRAALDELGAAAAPARGPSARTMADAMATIAARRHRLETVIDVGASNGSWSRDFMRHYPQSRYLLFEPQPIHREALDRFAREHGNVECVAAAAGAAPGEVYFDASDPLGGQASHARDAAHDVVLPLASIDAEVASRRLPGPYLIKTDTHGFEVPILDGAARTLAETEVLVIECYNFRIAPECLLFFEMCGRLQRAGFRCIDLVDPLWRDDGSLWQMDLVFVRESRPEFLRATYR